MKENKTIAELIEKAKTGDIDSLEKLLKKTEKEVYSFLYYLTKSEEELSDMVQEILLKVAKNLKHLKDVNLFKSWVNKIVIRQYYDTLRKNKKQPEKIELCETDTENLFHDKKRAPIEDCISSELIQAIKNSVCKLKEPYKIAILMREFEGLSYDEIAKATKTSVGTVKSRIARARCQLKEYIKPYME